MYRAIIIIATSLLAGTLQAQDTIPTIRLDERNKNYKLAGEIAPEIGKIFTVQGIILNVYAKSTRFGPCVLVQKINDSFVQKTLPVPYDIDIYEHIYETNKGESFGKLKEGETYELKVYETGSFIGTPPGTWDSLKSDVTMQPMPGGFHFRNILRVIDVKKIEPIKWPPIDFIGREALLTGTASNENNTAYIQGNGWKIRLANKKLWPKDEIGKPAEVLGTIRATGTKDLYDVEAYRSGLIELKDQVGKKVVLRGLVRVSNDDWSFIYRGLEIYVENMEALPGLGRKYNYCGVEIEGILRQEMLPDIEESSSHPADKLQFIIRNASWKLIPGGLLTDEIGLYRIQFIDRWKY